MIGRLAVSFPPGRGGLEPEQVARMVAALDEAKMAKGRIGPGQGSGVDDKIRSGSVQWIGPDLIGEEVFSHLWTLAKVANRERQWDFDLEGITPFLQGTRYAATGREHYAWHADWGLGPTRYRKISVVCHLSDRTEYRGGRLQLTSGARSVDAVQGAGMVTVFPSFLLHRVTPVTEGTRLGAVAWILGPSFR